LKKLNTIIAVLVITIVYGCTEPSDSSSNSSVDKTIVAETTTAYSNGKSIFLKHCSMCHSAGSKDDYFFGGIFERMPAPSEVYFIRFVGNSKLLKAGGDQYAKEVDGYASSDFEHSFKDSLSNQDFNDLITYIRVKTNQPRK
jgi:mono/diheme cytochrome c family protein